MPHICLFLSRNGKNTFEDFNLVTRDCTIRFRKLCGQGNDTDRKGNFIALANLAFAMPIPVRQLPSGLAINKHVPGKRAQQRPQWSANGQARRRSCNLAPNRHLRSVLL